MKTILLQTATITFDTSDISGCFAHLNEIYGLASQATKRIEYIGDSAAQSLEDRLRQHMTKARSGHPSDVHAWIRNLQSKGDKLIILPLPFRSEQEAIEYYGIDNLKNERNAQNGGAGRPITKRWSTTEDAQLGTMYDRALGRHLGRSRSNVARRRRKLGIPPFSC